MALDEGACSSSKDWTAFLFGEAEGGKVYGFSLTSAISRVPGPGF